MNLKKYFTGFKATILRYLILTSIVPLIISLIIIYVASRSALLKLSEQNIQNTVNSILKMCEAQSESIDNKIESDLKKAISVSQEKLSYFKKIYIKSSREKADITNRITLDKSTVKLPYLMADNKKLLRNFTFVDDIVDEVQLSGVTVTIYQLFGDKLIGVSTNVRLYNKERDIFSYIPRDSPIYTAVVSGQTFEERDMAVGKWSLSRYEPIRSYENEIVGALCVAVPIPKTALFDIIRQSKIGERGYIYVINSKGLAIEHPFLKNESLYHFKDADTGKEFIKEFITKGEGFFNFTFADLTEFEIPHKKIAYVRTFPKWDWFIVATVNLDDIFSSLAIIFKILIILISILSIILLITSARVVGLIFKPLKVIIDTAVKVSGGDLNVFIPQEHYNKCVKVKNCSYRECPAYETGNLACWRIDGTLCNDGRAIADNENKMEYCCECEVYQNAIRSETDELIEAINNMIVSIRQIIEEIQIISNELNSESNSLSDISSKMENETQNQAASIEETTSSNEELMAAIENVSESARVQADKVSQTSAAMEELTSSTRIVGENAASVSSEAKASVATAHETDNMLKETTRNINHVSESSQKIVAIVAMINDISDQINLLSLNAAIEAARAGEHGKGFAVVAEEISKLADATARSTREIENVIKKSRADIQSGAELLNKTATAITEMMQRIELSAKLFLEIAESSDEQIKGSEMVMKDVEEVNSMSERIAMATEEQKATSNEILRALSRVNESIQQIASSSQVISSSSKSLKNKSRELKDAIDKF